ncbi:MAG: hypothetical protein WCA81_13775 [Rhizomicrobium sp.]
MLKQYLPYLLPLVVVALVGFRMSRSMKGRRIKPWQLWIRPALIGVILGFSLVMSVMPSPVGLAIFAAALVVGLGLGYVLASHQTLTLDPASGAITSKTSLFGTILFFGVFAVRYVFNMTMRTGQAPDKLAAHSTQVLFYTDVALLFLFAMVGAQAWEIWRRTRPLVAQHAAATASKSVPE